jgi:hypothetical protein
MLFKYCYNNSYKKYVVRAEGKLEVREETGA